MEIGSLVNTELVSVGKEQHCHTSLDLSNVSSYTKDERGFIN